MSFLYVNSILLSCIMGCLGNHAISYIQNAFLGHFLHLSDPIEQINTHNEMSDVFNVGRITPGILIYQMAFHLFLNSNQCS